MTIGKDREGLTIGLSEKINSWITKKGIIVGLPELTYCGCSVIKLPIISYHK